MIKKDTFAFIIHPPELTDVAKKYPIAKMIPPNILKAILKYLPPVRGSQIKGFKLPSGEEVNGWVIGCLLTAEQMLKYPNLAKRKVLGAVHLAEKLGCNIAGLGAFTSIVTDGGKYLVDKVKISLTTGNAYAAALIIENMKKALQKIELPLKRTIVAVIGASGSVGSAVSKILSSKVKKIILIDSRKEDLKELVEKINNSAQGKIDMEFYNEIPVPINADTIVTVASASEGIVKPEHLNPATIVIDAAQPHNVSEEVINSREDVIVIHSGIAYLKGFDLGMNIGLAKEELYACLGEVLILLWRNWKGNYSLGKVNPTHVEEILKSTSDVGLEVAPFRNRLGMINNSKFDQFVEIKKAIR